MTETRRKGLSGLDKVLIGCGIGCAGLILVVVLGATFGGMWFFTPGKQIATDVIADDTSLGVVRLHELAEDPGTQELLTRLLERINEVDREQQRENLPPSLRWISDLQNQQADVSGLNMMIPKEMTIAFEPAENGSDPDFVVAANPRVMVRMVKTMLSLVSRSEGGSEIRSDYRDHAAYALEDDAHIAFASSTVLFASSRRALERAIDRVEASEAASGDPAAKVGVSARIPEGDWDIEGALSNEAGLVTSLLDDLKSSDDPEDRAAMDALGDDLGDSLIAGAGEDLRLSFGFDVASADEVTGRVVLECDDRQTAERWRSLLEQRYQERRDEAANRGLEIDLELHTVGDRVVSEWRLLGVETLIARAFRPPTRED